MPEKERISPDPSNRSVDDHEDKQRLRRLIRVSAEPLVTLPLHVAVPEQTEPEDLSMSTGLHSHSSGDSTHSSHSRSPSSREDIDEEELEQHDHSSAIFLQRRTAQLAYS